MSKPTREQLIDHFDSNRCWVEDCVGCKAIRKHLEKPDMFKCDCGRTVELKYGMPASEHPEAAMICPLCAFEILYKLKVSRGRVAFWQDELREAVKQEKKDAYSHLNVVSMRLYQMLTELGIGVED